MRNEIEMTIIKAAQAVVDDAYYSEEQDCCLVGLEPLEALENALRAKRKQDEELIASLGP